MGKLEEEPLLDTSDDDGDDDSSVVDNRHPNPPPTSPWKRAALIACVVLLVYFGLPLLKERKPKVIYASRYSKEHKFRPAASPIITETLKDGRIRLRGALPTTTPTPSPTKPAAKRRKTPKAGRASGKARRKKSSASVRQ